MIDIRKERQNYAQDRTKRRFCGHCQETGCRDQLEMLNLWGTPMTDTVNAWTCKFAMNQADINNDWDTYVAEVEAQNMQNIVDMYNDTYNASK